MVKRIQHMARSRLRNQDIWRLCTKAAVSAGEGDLLENCETGIESSEAISEGAVTSRRVPSRRCDLLLFTCTELSFSWMHQAFVRTTLWSVCRSLNGRQLFNVSRRMLS